jgi:hypothetical protein
MSGTGIPAVFPCGLQVLVLTAQTGATEVKTIGGWGSRGRETVKQKCWELVYQQFLPVVFKCHAGTDSSDGDYRDRGKGGGEIEVQERLSSIISGTGT